MHPCSLTMLSTGPLSRTSLTVLVRKVIFSSVRSLLSIAAMLARASICTRTRLTYMQIQKMNKTYKDECQTVVYSKIKTPLTIPTNDVLGEPISTMPRLSTEVIITVKYFDSSAVSFTMVDTNKVAHC